MLLTTLHIVCNREAHGRLLSRGWCLSRLKERRAPYLEEWQLTNDECAYVPYLSLPLPDVSPLRQAAGAARSMRPMVMCMTVRGRK